MTASDYIQLSIAVVAGIAAILTGLNIYFTNKQVNLQREQWNFSYVPIFRISAIKGYAKSTDIVIEITNAVFHDIEDITFSSEDVEIMKFHADTVEHNKEIHKGFVVNLSPENANYQVGYLQLTGVDALGNTFKVNSKAIEFKGTRLVNDKALIRTYLKKQ